jgi:hypothetical protein
MSKLVIDFTTDLRRLAADIAQPNNKVYRDLVGELCYIEQRISRGLSDLEMQTHLWYLWVVLEEINENVQRIYPQRSEQIQRLMLRIQSNAFRISQRWSSISQSRQPAPRSKSEQVYSKMKISPRYLELPAVAEAANPKPTKRKAG